MTREMTLTINATPGQSLATYAAMLSSVLMPKVKKTKAQERRDAAGTDRTYRVGGRNRSRIDVQAERMQAFARLHNATAARYRRQTTNIKKLRRLARRSQAT